MRTRKILAMVLAMIMTFSIPFGVSGLKAEAATTTLMSIFIDSFGGTTVIKGADCVSEKTNGGAVGTGYMAVSRNAGGTTTTYFRAKEALDLSDEEIYEKAALEFYVRFREVPSWYQVYLLSPYSSDKADVVRSGTDMTGYVDKTKLNQWQKVSIPLIAFPEVGEYVTAQGVKKAYPFDFSKVVGVGFNHITAGSVSGAFLDYDDIRIVVNEGSAPEPKKESIYNPNTSEWYVYQTPDYSKMTGTPLDVSYLLDAPAGKHGYLKASGEKFVFTDGTAANFWGTNVAAEVPFLPKNEIDTVVNTLAATGINLVRIMDIDSTYFLPNVFGYDTKKCIEPDSTSMDSFCYFWAKCKEKGIYIQYSLIGGRVPTESLGHPALSDLAPGFKTEINFDDRLVEYTKTLEKKILQWKNPYTNTTLATDPCVALFEINNESNFMNTFGMGNYKNEERFRITSTEEKNLFKKQFNAFLKTKYGTNAKLKTAWTESGKTALRSGENLDSGTVVLDEEYLNSGFSTQRMKDSFRFLYECQKNFHTKMINWLKNDMQVKVPISGTNNLISYDRADIFENAFFEYMDRHGYHSHPQSGTEYKKGAYTTNVNSQVLDYTCTACGNMARRVTGKPYIVTETNECEPNIYISENNLLSSAIYSYQGVSSLSFPYLAESVEESRRSYISEFFQVMGHPLRFGTLQSAALLYHRKEITEAKNGAYTSYTEAEALDPAKQWVKVPDGAEYVGRTGINMKAATGKEVADSAVILERAKHQNLVNENGDWILEKNVDASTGKMVINTKKTQAAIGCFAGETLSLDDVDIKSDTYFATISVSATGKSQNISNGDKLLVTAAARARNTGAEVSDDGKRIERVGRTPILCEQVKGRITFKTTNGYDIYILNSTGQRVKKATYWKNNKGYTVLQMQIGDEAMHYEVVKTSTGSTPTYSTYRDVPAAKINIFTKIKSFYPGLTTTLFGTKFVADRGDYVAAIVRALGLTASGTATYNDLDSNHQGYAQLKIAKQRKVIDATNLDPYGALTRSVAYTALYNGLVAKGTLASGQTPKTALVKQGIILDQGQDLSEVITREEAATLIAAALGVKPTSGSGTEEIYNNGDKCDLNATVANMSEITKDGRTYLKVAADKEGMFLFSGRQNWSEAEKDGRLYIDLKTAAESTVKVRIYSKGGTGSYKEVPISKVGTEFATYYVKLSDFAGFDFNTVWGVGIQGTSTENCVNKIYMVWGDDITTPTVQFTTQSKNGEAAKGATYKISAEAVCSWPIMTPKYQWYKNTTNSTSGGTKIAGAVNRELAVDTTATGITYYYCIATTLEGKTATSSVSRVRVLDKILPNSITLYSNGYSSSDVDQKVNFLETFKGDVPCVKVSASGAASRFTFAQLEDLSRFNFVDGKIKFDIFTSASSCEVRLYPKTGDATNYKEVTVSLAGTASTWRTASVDVTKFTGFNFNSVGGIGITVNAADSYVNNFGIYYENDDVQATAEIIKQPENVSVEAGKTARLQTVVSYAPFYKKCSYQWYTNTTDAYTDAQEISGAISSCYSAPNSTVGTKYYFCKITVEGVGTLKTEIAKVEIRKFVPTGGNVQIYSNGTKLSGSTLNAFNEVTQSGVKCLGVSYSGQGRIIFGTPLDWSDAVESGRIYMDIQSTVPSIDMCLYYKGEYGKFVKVPVTGIKTTKSTFFVNLSDFKKADTGKLIDFTKICGVGIVNGNSNATYINNISMRWGDQLPHATAVTTTSRMTGTTASVAPVSGGGAFRAGDEIQLRAAQKTGYTLVAWYRKVNGGAETKIADQTYSFTDSRVIAASDTTVEYIAEYKLNSGTSINVSVNGIRFTYKEGTGTATTYQTSVAKNYTKPTQVTLNYTDTTQKFDSWVMKDTGNVVSLSPTCTFTAVSNMNLQAVTDTTKSVKTASVIFLTPNSQLIATAKLSADMQKSAFVYPTAPAKSGYTFAGWSKTFEELLALTQDGVKQILVYPEYTKETSKITAYMQRVTTTSADPSAKANWTNTGSAVSYSSYKNVSFKFVAEKTYSGKTFMAFADQNGKLISYDRVADVVLSSGTKIYAVYGSAAPTRKASVVITSAAGVKESKNQTYTFGVAFNIPANCTVVQKGIVYGTDPGFGAKAAVTAENAKTKLTVSSADAFVFKGNTNLTSGSELITITKIPAVTTKLFARGYVTYKTSSGTSTTAYSEVAGGSIADGLKLVCATAVDEESTEAEKTKEEITEAEITEATVENVTESTVTEETSAELPSEEVVESTVAEETKPVISGNILIDEEDIEIQETEESKVRFKNSVEELLKENVEEADLAEVESVKDLDNLMLVMDTDLPEKTEVELELLTGPAENENSFLYKTITDKQGRIQIPLADLKDAEDQPLLLSSLYGFRWNAEVMEVKAPRLVYGIFAEIIPMETVIAPGENADLTLDLPENMETTFTYKWFKNTTASVEGAEEIPAAVENHFMITGTEVGEQYYYCVLSAEGYKDIVTNISKVTVEEPEVETESTEELVEK